MTIDPDKQLPGGPETVNEAFFDALIRHQIGLLRLSGSVRNDIFTILDATEPDLARQIRDGLRSGSGLETPSDVRRMDTLLKTIRSTRASAWKEVTAVWIAEMRELAKSEPDFVDGALKTVVPVTLETTIPSAASLQAIVTHKPFEGKTMRQWASSLAVTDIKRIEDQIKIGMVQGETNAQIVRRVVGTKIQVGRDGVTQITRNQAAGITRTAINGVANQAKRAYYRANKDIFGLEIFVATLDARTTRICSSLDGEEFPVGVGPIPPLHFNAVPEGTLITTPGGSTPIEALRSGDLVLTHKGRWKKVYATMVKASDTDHILEVELDTGGMIHITDDHPVLTRARGWVVAADLKVGDELFQHPNEEAQPDGRSCVVSEPDNHPSPFDEPLVPYHITSTSLRIGVSSFINLEGDLVFNEPEVNDAATHDMLMHRLPFKQLYERLLSWRNVLSHALGHGLVHLGSCLGHLARVGGLHSSAGPSRQLAAGLGISSAPVGRPSGPIHVLLVRHQTFLAGSVLDTQFLQPVEQLSRRGPNLPGDPVDTLPLLPVLDADELSDCVVIDHWCLSSVKSIHTIPNTLQLHNLGVEDDETYLANGVIVHNCRSLRVGVIDGAFLGRRPARVFTERGLVREFTKANDIKGVTKRANLPRGTKGRFDLFKAARIRELTGTVPAKVTYQQWLTRQSAKFQNDVLGKTRGRLFRRGELQLDKFVNRAGDEIPLSQLARVEHEAFIAAGLDPEDFI